MSAGYTKNEIESAILDTLRPLGRDSGGYVRVLEPYREDPDPAVMSGEALQLPAVFVSHSVTTYSRGPYLHSRATLGFNVTVLCRTGGSPDVFEILEDVRGLLCGSRLGLDVSPAELKRETALRRGRDTETYSALYTVTHDVELPAQAG